MYQPPQPLVLPLFGGVQVLIRGSNLPKPPRISNPDTDPFGNFPQNTHANPFGNFPQNTHANPFGHLPQNTHANPFGHFIQNTHAYPFGHVAGFGLLR